MKQRSSSGSKSEVSKLKEHGVVTDEHSEKTQRQMFEQWQRGENTPFSVSDVHRLLRILSRRRMSSVQCCGKIVEKP